jgi:hypothetical protein
MAAARKVDFDIALVQDADISVDSIKPGQELSVEFDESSGQMRCCTAADGLLLGSVPDAAARQLHGSFRITVRSVKKKPDDALKVAGVQARAVAADGGGGGGGGAQQQQQQHTQHQQRQAAAAAQPDDPSGFAVTVSQLQRLGALVGLVSRPSLEASMAAVQGCFGLQLQLFSPFALNQTHIAPTAQPTTPGWS